MHWTDREVQFPDLDEFIGYGSHGICIYRLIESKWGHRFIADLQDHRGGFEWTHWMPLPEPPKIGN